MDKKRTVWMRMQNTLWQIYDQTFKSARYIDLTHTLTPSIPVWSGFGPSQFGPTINGFSPSVSASQRDKMLSLFGFRIYPGRNNVIYFPPNCTEVTEGHRILIKKFGETR